MIKVVEDIGVFGLSKFSDYFSDDIVMYLNSFNPRTVDIFDKYLESEMKDGVYNVRDLKDWDEKWVDMVIRDAKRWKSER